MRVRLRLLRDDDLLRDVDLVLDDDRCRVTLSALDDPCEDDGGNSGCLVRSLQGSTELRTGSFSEDDDNRLFSEFGCINDPDEE